MFLIVRVLMDNLKMNMEFVKIAVLNVSSVKIIKTALHVPKTPTE